MTSEVKVDSAKVILEHKNAQIPQRATSGSVGYDLKSVEDVIIPSRGRKLVNTGIKIQVPSGTYGRIAPRSGLANKNGIDIGAGVIDPDYQGEVKVVMFNHDDKDFKVSIGDRIAQLIFEKVSTPFIQVVDGFTQETSRGSGGFGSTDAPKINGINDTDEKKVINEKKE